MTDFIDVVFDGPPSHEAGRFVEVEDPNGASIAVGEWIDRGDGLWALRIPLLSESVIPTAETEGDQRVIETSPSGVGFARGGGRKPGIPVSSKRRAWLDAPVTENEGEQ